MKRNEDLSFESCLVGINLADFELPENLHLFLSLDDQGMDGLETMLKYENISKRIPKEIMEQYQCLYKQIYSRIFEILDDAMQELKKKPDYFVHSVISQLYENTEK